MSWKTENPIGHRFGMLTVVKEVPPPGPRSKPTRYFECLCDCGNTTIAEQRGLYRSRTALRLPRSCGCILKDVGRPRGSLLGLVFGRLTVLEELSPRYYKTKKRTLWRCRCECGTLRDVEGSKLLNKTRPTRSCGCLTREATSRAKRVYDVGDRFGRLVILYRIPEKNQPNPKAACLCDCGAVVVAAVPCLSSGNTQSCGCLHRELMRGPTHPNWNPELTDAERAKGRGEYASEVNAARLAAFRRDSFSCQACGGVEGDLLNAHHIRPWALYENARFKVSNLVTVCEACHTALHVACGNSRMDCSKTTIPWLRAKRKETGYGQHQHDVQD